MVTRREMLLSGAALTGGAVLAGSGQIAHGENADETDQARSNTPQDGGYGPKGPTHVWEESYSGGPVNVTPRPPGLPGRDYQPVIVPAGGTLPFKIVDGVKVFHLTVEEIEHEFAPGLRARCWGYGGRVNSTVIEAVEGERVRIYVTNRLPAPTTVHWHGIYLPNGMDGASGTTQPHIKPGETFKYEWTLRQHGTFMFHSHHDTMTQEGMGLIGSLIIHPRDPEPGYYVDRDFSIMLSEWAIEPGTARPNTLENSDFNILTMNGKCFPGTEPLVCRTGQKVRIRFANLSQMDHHPIHLHGYHFKITATDGEDIPASAQWPETTVLVAVGQTRNIEFISDAPGDWLMHCHMTHHIMNQMGHNFPNMVGVDPSGLNEQVRSLLPGYMTMGNTGMGKMGKMAEQDHMPVPDNSIPMKGAMGPFGDYIPMGGMFSLVKVRDRISDEDLATNKDPGWYDHPQGTVAWKANPRELERDGIDVNAKGSTASAYHGTGRKGSLARVNPTPPAAKAHMARWGPSGGNGG